MSMSKRMLPPIDDRYLDVEEAASYLKLSKPSIYRRVSDNTIPHIKLGRRVLFERDTLDEWVASHRAPATAKDAVA